MPKKIKGFNFVVSTPHPVGFSCEKFRKQFIKEVNQASAVSIFPRPKGQTWEEHIKDFEIKQPEDIIAAEYYCGFNNEDGTGK